MDMYRRVIPKKTLMIPCAKTLAGDILNFLVLWFWRHKKLSCATIAKNFINLNPYPMRSQYVIKNMIICVIVPPGKGLGNRFESGAFPYDSYD